MTTIYNSLHRNQTRIFLVRIYRRCKPTTIKVSNYDNNTESTSILFLSQRALTSLFLQWCGWAWSSHCSHLGPGAVLARCPSGCTLWGGSSRLLSLGLQLLWSSVCEETGTGEMTGEGDQRLLLILLEIQGVTWLVRLERTCKLIHTIYSYVISSWEILHYYTIFIFAVEGRCVSPI